ncbi:MAG: PorT family protein [Hymenobacter sp.]|nr:MAG: PorT family protein [Hymenobacter sp.]
MTKNYFRLVLPLAFGLGSVTAHAQADFQPGYIVQSAGDTLRGEVDYRDARLNNNQCRFRARPEAAATIFLPATLRAYGLRDGSKLYRSLTLPISAGKAVPATSPAGERYFLEVLADGPASLYSWRDTERADHYYVATDKFPLTELVHRKVLLEQERILQEQNTYRNTLAQALAGCPVAQAQLPALAFTARALAAAVAAYNACQQPAQVVQAAKGATPPMRKARQRPRFGIVLGAKRTTTELRYVQTYSSVDLALAPDNGPVGGLSFNLPLTALSNKLSLEAELLYENHQYSQTLNDRNPNGGRGVTNYRFDMSYLQLPLLIRYTFPAGRLQPLAEVGPVLGYAVKLTAETTGTDYYGQPQPRATFLPNNQQRFQEGLSGSIGVRFGYWQQRQATLLARYERDSGWTEGTGINSASNHFYALLTLDLF